MSIHELRGKEVEPGGSGFIEMLEARQRGVDSLLCVGLDPVIDNIPDSFRNSWQLVHMSTQAERNAAVLARFNYKIIDATAPYVSTYKPNSAFYERYGIAGLNALKSTIDHIKSTYPTIPVILDAKRADIGNTNKGYAEMLQTIGADAITVNPYFGIEGKGALDPFLELGEKGIIVLCRTSNPEAVKMQDVIVMDEVLGEVPYYMRVARMAEEARQKNSNVAIVVGATVPDQLRAVRGIFKGIILVPGLGKQGGRPEDLVGAFDERGLGIIANNASAIIHASKEEDFVGAAARAALDWRNSINEARKLPRREMDVVREDRVKQILAETGAVITGSHFVYASGLHGEAYVNKDAVYSNPRNIRELCRMMANDFRREGVEVVVGPVAGGVALSMETALALGVEAAYADKTEDG